MASIVSIFAWTVSSASLKYSTFERKNWRSKVNKDVVSRAGVCRGRGQQGQGSAGAGRGKQGQIQQGQREGKAGVSRSKLWAPLGAMISSVWNLLHPSEEYEEVPDKAQGMRSLGWDEVWEASAFRGRKPWAGWDHSRRGIWSDKIGPKSEAPAAPTFGKKRTHYSWVWVE